MIENVIESVIETMIETINETVIEIVIKIVIATISNILIVEMCITLTFRICHGQMKICPEKCPYMTSYLTEVRSSVINQTLKSTEIIADQVIFIHLTLETLLNNFYS